MRIVEIGSGSGGTSAVVMDALAGCGSRVDFIYTDLSPQLVAYGRRTFGPRHTFARFHTLDVERALAPQVGCRPRCCGPPRAKFYNTMCPLPAEAQSHWHTLELSCRCTIRLNKPAGCAALHRLVVLRLRALASAAMTSCLRPTCCMRRGTWRPRWPTARRCCGRAGCCSQMSSPLRRPSSRSRLGSPRAGGCTTTPPYASRVSSSRCQT